ncbi:efflux RND transporter periplasmic adaptor subunit [Candidatus Palauibacter soopunensis]|uniref:efflux RND transporter periplasmic adaptor subunit n=1 Tax=Candidatus Palauibacter soopunensis TaxID=3056739 RepID=UPI00239BBF0F|nr:efflux RND transporter periplasmic adaptor subunit [Candidatus Palauibacter soopunensis]MDE2878786.1 efflux RND transporter periplasmic adaptor subunit [Candidatus Palauibacter soopunensis]
MKKAIIAVVVVVLLATMGFLATQREGRGAVEVRVEAVGLRDLIDDVSATGHIEPKTHVDITTDVAGRIIELPVEEGQDVEEGDLLLQIDPALFRAAVERAEAGLAQAQANLAQQGATYRQAQRDADRLTALQARGTDFVTEAEVEQAVTNADVQNRLLEASEHQVHQAEASLDQERDRLGKTTIRAPMSGRITRLNVERGETAIVGTMNNPGSLLLTVADLSVMEAVIEVDETDVPDITIGDSAYVEIDAFPNRRFVGTVTEIGNSSIVPLNPATSGGSAQAIDFEVRIELREPPEGIRPDLSATADVITATRDQVPSIPITALTLMDADEYEEIPNENLPSAPRSDAARDIEGVFVVEGDIVRFRPVEIGIAGENYFEVMSGIELGTTVVSGSFQAIRELSDGSRIRIDAPAGGGAANREDGSGGSDAAVNGEDGR